MRKPLHHHIKQSIVWLGLVLLAFGTAQASGNEDDKPKDRPQPNDGKTTATQAEAVRMQKAMNKALSSLNLDFANVQPESIMQPLVADETNAAKERAITTFEKVKYMSELSVLNTVLPVGIKETIGNTTVEVAVATLNIYPAYAEVTIYCRMHFKDKNAPNGERDVFFGAQNVKIGSGGLIDGAELALLGDVTIPFGDHSFTLKGGFDEKTGAAKSLTYVKVGCKGFEYVSVNGLMKFSRNQVLPYDATTDLDIKTLSRYKTLTEDEIKQLAVDDKWMTSIERSVKTEMERISQRLTQRIKELAERYETPMPQQTTEVAELEAKVTAHLEKMGFVWQ